MRDALLAATGLLIVTLLAALVYQNYRRFHRPLLTTPYQAVTLRSGEVFYGRMDHLGSDHPVLRDAFTVRREADEAAGEPRYVLLRRRDDVTGADHLILPASSIAFIEPVQPDSAIGRLIDQASGRRR
jgi:hypothetical protein